MRSDEGYRKRAQAIQLSSKSVEHYTPEDIVERARLVMGSIDLDPASCELAQRTVKAGRYYSERGLEQEWFGNVFLNPPGGKGQTPGLWWATLAHSWELGLVRSAHFIMFNLEVLRYAQRFAVKHPLDFVVCFPKDRIDFSRPNADGTDIETQGDPAHPNAIVYLPPKDALLPSANVGRFRDAFSGYGKIVT